MDVKNGNINKGHLAMRRLVACIRRKFSNPIPKPGAIFLVITGILIGTVFTVGTHFWGARVTKVDAVSVSATFFAYKEVYRCGHIKEIIVRFVDHEQLTVDGVCLTREVISKVESLKPGTVLNLYIHPNSSNILEMVDNGDFIIVFDEAIDKLAAEVSGFTVLGIFMYFCAALGIIKLVKKETY